MCALSRNTNIREDKLISPTPSSRWVASCVSCGGQMQKSFSSSRAPRVAGCAGPTNIIGRRVLWWPQNLRGTSVMKRGQRRWNSRTSPLILSAALATQAVTRWRFHKHESTTVRAFLLDSITLEDVRRPFLSPVYQDGACSGSPSPTCITARLFLSAFFPSAYVVAF